MLRDRLLSKARSVLGRLEDRYRARVSKPEPVVEQPPVIEEPPKKPVNWEMRSQAELVDHIVDHYHAGLRRDLPRLIAAARSVDKDLAALLEQLESDLESHMAKEERILFPNLRTGQRGGSIDMPIRMMEREHETHDELLVQIRAATDGKTGALYTELTTLETDLREHIYLENNVLFARALGGEY